MSTTRRRPALSPRLPERVHAESLLRIPLVRAAFSHPTFAPRARGVDLRWYYLGVVDHTLTGFVPLQQDVFFGRHSRTADWRRHPGRSARTLNAGDHLVEEVLFAVHDHLHAWALSAIRDLVPDLAVRPGLGARDIEDLVFVHLATEAAATVGLDYWYLSALEPTEICDVGTLRYPLTTRYHERYLPEYRRFRPDLVVQDPKFFGELARFYADGQFVGFDAADIARSPRLAHWLLHEVLYGQRQREYIRQWLAFMTGTRADLATLGRPARTDARWQRVLLRELAESLWHYVKNGIDRTSRRPAGVRTRRPAPRDLPFDPRFVNVRTLSLDAVLETGRSVTDPVSLGLLCDQLITTFDFARFDRRLMPALLRARSGRDLPAIHALLRGGPQVPASPDEPRELFLLS